MKKSLRLMIGLGLIAPLLAVAPVVAANNSTASSPPASSNSSDAEDQPLTETQKTELHDRLEKQKVDLKIKLTVAETALIKSKCTAAQTVIKALDTRFLNNTPQRTKAYEELSSRINTLIGKLQAGSINATELQQELTALQGKITTYQADLDAYKQALGDVKNVDCTTNPDSFKAALQTARTDRDKLTNDTADIKSYVQDTIKPTLQKLRTQLAAQKSNTSQRSN